MKANEVNDLSYWVDGELCVQGSDTFPLIWFEVQQLNRWVTNLEEN